MSTDSASKHALHGYFDCLRCELAPRGIHVTMVCPGYINTQLSINSLSGDGSKHGGIQTIDPANINVCLLILLVTDATTARGMTPEYAAQQILHCVAAGGRSLVLTTPTYHLALYLSFFCPSLLDWILRRRAKVT